MKYRPFGKTGLEVSEIVFGCGAVGGLMINASDEARQDAFDLAVTSGINWFDTAAAYGQGQSETNLGSLLANCDARPHVSTKLTIDTRNADVAGQVEESLASSLKRLQSDKVTLLQLHNPIAAQADKRVIGVSDVLKNDGVLDAMARMQEQGLCDHIGITALGEPASVIEVINSGQVSSAQVYYNMLNASAAEHLPAAWPHFSFEGVLAACQNNGVAAMNIRVFSAGVIATDARHGRERPLTAGDTVESETRKATHLFQALDTGADTRAQTAIRFSLAEEKLACVVVGLAELAHLEQAIAAGNAGPLTAESLATIKSAWATLPDSDG